MLTTGQRVATVAAILMVIVALAAGLTLFFSGDGSGGSGGALPDDDASEASVTEPTTSTTKPTTSTDPEPVSELANLEALWAALWTASGLAAEERAPAIAELGDAIDPDVAEGVPTLVEEIAVTEATTHPVLTESPDGTVEIEDCIFYEPGIRGATSHLHRGTAEPDGEGGWVITGLSRVRRGCIPADMAETVLGDYDEYDQASLQYWNPPDPDHPGIDQTLTGELRDIIRQRVAENAEEGWRLVEEFDVSHPEITDVFLPTQVQVTDCREVDERGGIFDAEGSRHPDFVPVRPGQRDILMVTLSLEGGQWKVEEITGDIDVDCQLAPTPDGIPVIG